MLVEYLPLLMLITMAVLLFTGFPVGGILAGVAIGFALIGVVIDELRRAVRRENCCCVYKGSFHACLEACVYL